MKKHIKKTGLLLFLIPQIVLGIDIKEMNRFDFPLNQGSFSGAKAISSSDGKMVYVPTDALVQKADSSILSQSSAVLAVETATLEQKWSFPTDRIIQLTKNQDAIFAVTYSTLVGIDPSGSGLWTIPNFQNRGATVALDGSLFLFQNPDLIEQIDSKSGKKTGFSVKLPPALSTRGYLAGAFSADALLIASSPDNFAPKLMNQISLIDKTGKPGWTLPVQSGYSGVVDINPDDSTILLADYISAGNPDPALKRKTKLTALRFGEETWTYLDFGRFAGFGAGRYYFLTGNEGTAVSLVALERSTGKVVWNVKLPAEGMDTIPIDRSLNEIGDSVILGGSHLLAFDKATGAYQNKYRDNLGRFLTIEGGADDTWIVYANSAKDNQPNSLVQLRIK